MTNRKAVSISKPTLAAKALSFASGTPETAKRGVGKVKGNKTVQGGSQSLSGKVPQNDVRLTANIRQDLHLKLKIAAANRHTTIGELLEDLVEQYL